MDGSGIQGLIQEEEEDEYPRFVCTKERVVVEGDLPICINQQQVYSRLVWIRQHAAAPSQSKTSKVLLLLLQQTHCWRCCPWCCFRERCCWVWFSSLLLCEAPSLWLLGCYSCCISSMWGRRVCGNRGVFLHGRSLSLAAIVWSFARRCVVPQNSDRSNCNFR